MPIPISQSAARQWRLSYWPMLLVMIIAGIIYAVSLPAHQVGTWTDDGFYISLARSLAAGEGMRLIHLPGQPVTAIVPPGLPLLLSPVAWLLPDNVAAFQWVSLLFTLATLPLFWRFATSRLTPALALIALVLFALNPTVVSASTWVMSEAPFVFFLLLSVLMVEKLVSTRSTASWPLLIGAALATAAILLMRYFGLPVVGAIVIYVLIRLHNWRAVAFVAVVGLGVIVPTLGFGAEAAWARYGSVGAGLLGFLNLNGSTINDSASAAVLTATSGSSLGFGAALLRNTQHLLTSALPDTVILLFGGPQVAALFASRGLGFAPIAVQTLISAAIIAGWLLCDRRRITVVEVIVPAYVAFLLVITQGQWQDSGSGFRYIFPMIPFASVYFLCTVDLLDRTLRRQAWWPVSLRSAAVVTGLVAAGLLLLYLARDAQAVVNPVRDRLPDVALGARWINENVPADAVVLAEVPRVSYIYAQRSMVPYPYDDYESEDVFGDVDACTATLCVAEVIERFGVDYVLVTYQISPVLPFHWSGFTTDFVVPFMESDPSRFQVVYSGPDNLVRVYHVDRGALYK